MSWTEPITDRTLTDIQTRTAKAFLNVSDWVRIDGNTSEVQAQILALLGATVSLNDLTEPTITQFPDVAEINTLIENIGALQAGACLPTGTGIIALKHDYVAGNGAVAPDYQAVNAWETNLKLIHDLLPNAADYTVHCGVATAGQPRFWQARFR
jgi:hypothetical protein